MNSDQINDIVRLGNILVRGAKVTVNPFKEPSLMDIFTTKSHYCPDCDDFVNAMLMWHGDGKEYRGCPICGSPKVIDMETVEDGAELQ